MKKFTSSQTAIFVMNLVKHSFFLWVSLSLPGSLMFLQNKERVYDNDFRSFQAVLGDLTGT